MSIVYSTRLGTSVQKVITHLAGLRPGTEVPSAFIAELTGIDVCKVGPAMSVAEDRRVLEKLITSHGAVYSLVDGLLIRWSNNKQYLDVWREGDDDDELDRPVVQRWVKACAGDRPMTSAPISVFHLAGGQHASIQF